MAKYVSQRKMHCTECYSIIKKAGGALMAELRVTVFLELVTDQESDALMGHFK